MKQEVKRYKAVTLQGTVVVGYLGEMYYPNLDYKIPVIYVENGVPYCVYEETIQQVLPNFTCKNAKELALNDVFIVDVKTKDDKTQKIYACLKEVDNSVCLCPFADNLFLYKNLDKIQLSDCEYVGPLTRFNALFVQKLLKGDSVSIIGTIPQDTDNSTVEANKPETNSTTNSEKPTKTTEKKTAKK